MVPLLGLAENRSETKWGRIKVGFAIFRSAEWVLPSVIRSRDIMRSGRRTCVEDHSFLHIFMWRNKSKYGFPPLSCEVYFQVSWHT